MFETKRWTKTEKIKNEMLTIEYKIGQRYDSLKITNSQDEKDNGMISGIEQRLNSMCNVIGTSVYTPVYLN